MKCFIAFFMVMFCTISFAAEGDRTLHKNPNNGKTTNVLMKDSGGQWVNALAMTAEGLTTPGATIGKLTHEVEAPTCANGGTILIDGSKNLYNCSFGGAAGGTLTLDMALEEGQQVSWRIANPGTGALVISFPNNLWWRDGVVFNTVDPSEASVYTFFKIGGQTSVASMTNLELVP